MDFFLSLLKAFSVGGLICLIAQILIDKTAMTPARILVLYVSLGVILTGIGMPRERAKAIGKDREKELPCLTRQYRDNKNCSLPLLRRVMGRKRINTPRFPPRSRHIRKPSPPARRGKRQRKYVPRANAFALGRKPPSNGSALFRGRD